MLVSQHLSLILLVSKQHAGKKHWVLNMSSFGSHYRFVILCPSTVWGPGRHPAEKQDRDSSGKTGKLLQLNGWRDFYVNNNRKVTLYISMTGREQCMMTVSKTVWVVFVFNGQKF